MSNPLYVKSEPGKWAAEGLREVEAADLTPFDPNLKSKILLILEAMDWPQLIKFYYYESDRLVAPFVVGVSSEGNPLLRGFQLEGASRSGKIGGWRVFQIRKMENLANYQDYFDPADFKFSRYYPWIYKVFKTL